MSAVSAEPAWLAERRGQASAALPSLPLPDKKTPGWEFTDLRGFDDASYGPAPGDAADASADVALLDAPEAAIRLEQIDGVTRETESSLPDGVTVLPLAVAAERHPELVEPHLGRVVGVDDAFTARNAAEWTGGAFVHVARNVAVGQPIVLNVLQATAGTALHRRTLVVLEEGAEAEVWESLLSADAAQDGFVTTVVELSVGAGARLRFVSAQELSEKTSIFGAQRGVVGRDGALDWITLGFGSARGKVRLETQLDGSGSEAKVTGAYASRHRQHVDFDTLQVHAAPNTVSDLAFRGIVADRSTAVWHGMIKVEKNAQQTDAFQESRNLLLGRKAHADAIPGLEIEADDVRCTHAAAIAQIEADQLFYLRSRGVPDAIARRLVIEGFLSALVERVEEGPLRQAIGEALDRRLSAVLGVA